MTEHDELRKQLPAYCGDDLAPVERKRIEKHLSSCPDCRAEVADLETTLRLVRSQPVVEPPPWLAGRVMARVREEAEAGKRGWLQRLFFPLPVKLPLEALAIAIVCVVSYYIVRDSGQQLLSPQVAPSPASVPAVEEKGAVPQGDGQPAARPLPVERDTIPTSPAAPVGAPLPTVQDHAPLPPRPAVEPGAVPSALRDEAMPAARAKDAVKDERAPSLETAPRLQQAAPEAKKSRAFDKGAVRSDADSSSAAPAALIQPLQVRLLVADPEGAEPAIRHAVAEAGGTVAREPAPRQLVVRVPAQRLPELLAKLAVIGRLTEKPVAERLSGSVDLIVSW